GPGPDPRKHADPRTHCHRSPAPTRRDQRQESWNRRRRSGTAVGYRHSPGAVRRARRIRSRRSLSAVGRRLVHDRLGDPGRWRTHQGTPLNRQLVSMSIARKVLLAMSTNAWLREHATKTAFVRRSVSTFMPGERLEDAIAAAAAQQARGIGTILTKLGENLTRVEEAEEVTEHYLDTFDKVKAARLNAQISVKPTQLGLDLDKELCFDNLQRLVDRASERDGFLW